ncbi:hypothetical protein FD31_GL001015 [Companilactobacillus nantensis DSM 16982]|uniref:Uncharacterized protein n=2 Tax=Companilactobacillus nantensis TaxID=305793 RepID=A0A0R1WTM5_9LACO|nr:hypothetical protein FD31_GL001015 [Companilactobacillus nantensis DSM 16982]
MNMSDRTNETMIIYDKTSAKVAEGEKGTKKAKITGLAPGTVVADGEYQNTFKDATTGQESGKSDVKGFTVKTPVPDAPVNESSDATNDGATISAE